ncbi:MAG: hypothetical protein WDN25_20420 [Acetobacteraceae bacterium]
MVVVANLGTARLGEEPFGAIRVDAARHAVGRAVVDPVHLVAGVQIVP